MANDMMNTLRSLLGDNADEKIKTVMQAIQSGSGSSGASESAPSSAPAVSKTASPAVGSAPEGFEYLAQIKNIVDQMGSANDSRSQLLMSLRPYMRKNRQRGIDNAVKILNMARFSGLFRNL